MNDPVISKLECGSPLGLADRATLEAITASTVHVPAHQDIVRENEIAARAHLLLEGFACRYKILRGGRRAILACLLPGDLCDAHDAFVAMDHSVATITPCVIAIMTWAAVEDLMTNHPRISRALSWARTVDESILREWLANMGQRPADRQLAHLICELFARLRIIDRVSGSGFNFPFTQEELGDMLGISSVHVNRVLQQLREDGLIALHGRVLTILDPARLEQFAEFNRNYLHIPPRLLAAAQDRGELRS